MLAEAEVALDRDELDVAAARYGQVLDVTRGTPEAHQAYLGLGFIQVCRRTGVSSREGRTTAILAAPLGQSSLCCIPAG